LILRASAVSYIKKYQSTYNKILLAAKKSLNVHTILYSSNQIKALWNIIRDETGKSSISHQNISLEMGPMLTSIKDPQCLSYQFNGYFVDSVDRMFAPPNDARGVHVPATKISRNINSMFATPIMEEELLKVVGKLRMGSHLVLMRSQHH
jgi:hypothetical protein